MTEHRQELTFESSDWYQGQTAHGLLALAYEQAQQIGLFTALTQHVTLKMKTRTYSVHDKLTTLLASILIGCDHTAQINLRLGPHEQALAALFGFERFPEQSTINRVLTACTQQTVEQLRELVRALHIKTTRARRRRLRRKLRRGHGRVLFVDIDQRGIVVSGKHYELAEAGFFGRKRGRRGYQLTLAYIGGDIGEVLDEYLDPGATPACHRIDDVLASVERFASSCRIPLDRIIIRADAQYGTPAIVEKIRARGIGFLVRGISSRKGAVLARTLEEEAFEAAARGAEGQARWVSDLGVQQIKGKKEQGVQPLTQARTVLVRWLEPTRAAGSRPGAHTRAKRAEVAREPEMKLCYSYVMTSLTPEQLAARQVLDFYDDRATIERYFRDEQGALGARSVRTHRAAGAAVFQLLVALANNLLRRMSERFKGTPLEGYGIERLVTHLMQVPARLLRSGRRLRVILPERHSLTQSLLRALAPPPAPAPTASPSPSSG